MAQAPLFLPSIQALRAIAALMVVLYHVESGINGWFAPASRLPSCAVGAAGVDLFFLISGFIMVVTSANLSSREFLLRRLVRIVPLYWLSLLIFLAAAQVVPPREGQDHSLPAILASFLFIPYTRPNGTMQPLNPVGWTLNYEMMFYLVFALALALQAARGRVAPIVSMALGAAVLAGMLLKPETAALRFWSAPIVLEFVAGMAVGRLLLSGVRIGPAAAASLAVLGVVALVLPPSAGEPAGWWRVFLWGGPSLLILAAAALGPTWPVPRTISLVGDASYSLYLLHLPVLLVFKQVGPRLPLAWQAAPTPWLVAFALVALSLILAVASYTAFERPLTRHLGARFGARRPEATARASAS